MKLTIFMSKKSLDTQPEFIRKNEMFERNVVYSLIDHVGLQKEPMAQHPFNIADEIKNRGGIITAKSVGSFGDIHAIAFGNKTEMVIWIPREFVKYFEPIYPEAFEGVVVCPIPKPKTDGASNIIKFKKRDDWCHPRMGRTNTFSSTNVKSHVPPPISNKTNGVEPIRRSLKHIHLEARCVA